jgi:DNA-binding NarL/FixJ family response regulator
MGVAAGFPAYGFSRALPEKKESSIMKPRVIVADDHRLVAEGVVKILEKEYDVVATPTDGRAFVEAVEQFHPDLVLVDISLPLLNGLDACRRVKKSFPGVKIIILTMHSEQHFVDEAFRVGVEGYLLKSSVADELLVAAREVLKGSAYVSPGVTRGLVYQALGASTEAQGQPRPVQPVTLSLRQREVLQLVAEGKSNKEIASTINVTVKTIEFHKARISKELGVHTTAELTKQAITLGLVSKPETTHQMPT